MTETADAVPSTIRRLDSAAAARLAGLVGAYDDLQTVLRCCERLLAMLGRPGTSEDDVGVEALWTLALLCYARGFGAKDGIATLTEADLQDAAGGGDAVRWHRVLMHLRDHHADPGSNPRETYTVGVAQDSAGAVNAVAVTSVHAPLVDQDAVRQAGVLTLPLCAVLDQRIGELQKQILDEVRGTPTKDLEAMDPIEVTATT